MPYVDFTETKKRIDIRDVLDLLGWRPHPRCARRDRGPCPIHRSHSPRSRSLSVGSGGYYCWRCGSYGDALRLYAEATRQPLYLATLQLCVRLGVPVVWRRIAPPGFSGGPRNGEEAR